MKEGDCREGLGWYMINIQSLPLCLGAVEGDTVQGDTGVKEVLAAPLT